MDSSTTKSNSGSKTEFSFDPHSGGKEAIHRILEAYGFTTRQALCAHLGVSQSTMANRYMRNNFPADWILTCSLDTGADLLWLATGKGKSGSAGQQGDITKTLIVRKKITNGMITDHGEVYYDSSLLPDALQQAYLIDFEGSNFICETYRGDVSDGVWLFLIDGFASIRELSRFPGGRIKVANGANSFECSADEIEIIGKVRSQITHFKE